MKKTIIYILLVYLLSGCINNSDDLCSKLSSYSEINDLVRQVIEVDTAKSIFDTKEIYCTLNSTDAIFNIENLNDFLNLTEDDIQLMRLQDSIYTRTHLHPEIFHEYKIVNDTNCGVFRKYSVPLLSVDKKYLFIEIGYDIGFLSGTGYLVIFEKINDKWVEKHRFFQWIS